jgi:hypothetical protein
MGEDIYEYKTAWHAEIPNLDNEVNELLREGWFIYGEPYAFGGFACQPLIRYLAKEDK